MPFNLWSNSKPVSKLINTKNSVYTTNLPKYQLSKFTHLPVLENGQTALPSNANNFHGQWNASVNSRTGSSSFSFTMDNILYAQGQAKYSLILSYAGGASAGGPDLFGLGSHWSWNVGTEHPSTSEIAGHLTTDITTGDGHSFTMASDRDSNGNTIWHPLRHKLQDVLITGQPNNWTISMSNGLREHISNGYENWQQSRSGYRIWFYYDHVSKNNQTKHLKYICAHQLTTTEVQNNKNSCTNDGIMITRANNKITVNGLQKFTITENYINGIKQVHSVIMPSLSSSDVNSLPGLKSVVDFAYDTQRKSSMVT